MTAQNSQLGNIMSRLQGLKSVAGRRKVMPEADFLQDLDDSNQDVVGTAQELPDFSQFIPPTANQPEEDLGGELTSQSYDIRANTVENPEQSPEQSPGFWSKVGGALADYVNPQKRAEIAAKYGSGKSMAQTPPIETAQVDMQEGIPPVTASEEETPGFLEAIKSEAGKPYNPLENMQNPLAGLGQWLKETNTPKIAPETYERHGITKPPQMMAQEQQQQQLDQEAINSAQQNPWQVAAYGATNAFANDPELVSDFAEYTGINFDDQQREMTEKYEKVLADIEKGNTDNANLYDEQEKRILQRIMNNESNDADKYYIGLALLMPLLVGGMFGKEAALGALGGGAKGIADVLGQRQKNVRADEEALLDIYKQKSANSMKKGELELEKLKIPEQIKKNMPKDEYADLKGKNIYAFKDPKTGALIAEGAELLPDLILDLKYGNTEKRRDEAEKVAKELANEKSYLERANEATEDVANAASQLQDSGLLAKVISYALSDDDNGALKKLVRQTAPDIVMEGRKQNAAVYLDRKIEQIKDAYRRNEQMRAFTQTVADHIGSMVDNPLYSGLQPKDLIDQVLGLRDRSQQLFVDKAESNGFIGDPLRKKFQEMNSRLFAGLNRKEEMSELERDKQLMHASE